MTHNVSCGSAAIEHVPDLSLAKLKEAAQAWAENEYDRKIHSETGEAWITRFLAGPSVMRPCPDSAALRLAFTRTERRSQKPMVPSSSTAAASKCRTATAI
jgi:putative transposase